MQEITMKIGNKKKKGSNPTLSSQEQTASQHFSFRLEFMHEQKLARELVKYLLPMNNMRKCWKTRIIVQEVKQKLLF